jgi:hypothetical protein
MADLDEAVRPDDRRGKEIRGAALVAGSSPAMTMESSLGHFGRRYSGQFSRIIRH